MLMYRKLCCLPIKDHSRVRFFKHSSNLQDLISTQRAHIFLMNLPVNFKVNVCVEDIYF